MNTYFKARGFREALYGLKHLEEPFQHRIIGAANREAAEPLIKRAQSIVQKKEGDLSESIGAVLKPQRKTKQLGIVWVGPRRVKGKFRGNHGHLIEFGHRISKQKIQEGGNVLGFVRPYPYMRPAFISTKDQVIQKMRNSLVDKLNKWVKRNYVKNPL